MGVYLLYKIINIGKWQKIYHIRINGKNNFTKCKKSDIINKD